MADPTQGNSNYYNGDNTNPGFVTGNGTVAGQQGGMAVSQQPFNVLQWLQGQLNATNTSTSNQGGLSTGTAMSNNMPQANITNGYTQGLQPINMNQGFPQQNPLAGMSLTPADDIFQKSAQDALQDKADDMHANMTPAQLVNIVNNHASLANSMSQSIPQPSNPPQLNPLQQQALSAIAGKPASSTNATPGTIPAQQAAQQAAPQATPPATHPFGDFLNALGGYIKGNPDSSNNGANYRPDLATRLIAAGTGLSGGNSMDVFAKARTEAGANPQQIGQQEQTAQELQGGLKKGYLNALLTGVPPEQVKVLAPALTAIGTADSLMKKTFNMDTGQFSEAMRGPDSAKSPIWNILKKQPARDITAMQQSLVSQLAVLRGSGRPLTKEQTDSLNEQFGPDPRDNEKAVASKLSNAVSEVNNYLKAADPTGRYQNLMQNGNQMIDQALNGMNVDEPNRTGATHTSANGTLVKQLPNGNFQAYDPNKGEYDTSKEYDAQGNEVS